MQKRSVLLSAAVLSLAAVFCFGETSPTTQPALEKRTVTPTGLTIIEQESGNAVAAAGDTVWVRYTGKLENGTKFDSSDDHAETRAEGISFTLGQGRVIKGWDEGIAGMKIGDRRKLIIPPSLGYGPAGAGDKIPANATLVFEVELVGLKRG